MSSESEDLAKCDEQFISMAVLGLHTDGAHHKQWVIEEMLKLAGVELKGLEDIHGKWERGIAP